ncbi:MAG: primosomal protein N' [Tissierellia bacterium]|nr:primosomal protein N' [Tissierellia bacterium]
MFYDVIIKSKTRFLDSKFTYKSQDDIALGSRVVVPFGRTNSLRLAFVLDKFEEIDSQDKIKEIEEVIDISPILNEDQIILIDYMVDNYLSDYSSAIQSLLPPGSIDKIVEYFSLAINEDDLDLDKRDFFRTPKTYEQIEKAYPKVFTKSLLNELVKRQVLYKDYSKKARASRKYIYKISLVDQVNLPANAVVQRRIVDYLRDNGTCEKDILLKSTKANLQSLKALIEKEVIKVDKIPYYRDVLDKKIASSERPKLNDEQALAYDKIINGDARNYLIHGITGSGKTEVYMNLVEHYIKLGKEAIILVPEISLTPQTISRFHSRFGEEIAVLHSKLTISERYDQWTLIKKGKVKIVVGARSAIFAPFKNIGIIIVDEEHESSYKSEKNPKYDAIDIAMKRAELSDAKLVLGTATPSIERMYKVYQKEIELIRLNKRATNAKLPEIEVVDMTEELKMENFSMFSNSLKKGVETALAHKHQTILFLNKRGHTSFVFCRSCGYVYRCEACDVAMTYHKYNDRLVCHFCGRTAKKKRTCDNCGSTYIKEFGAGTEKLEEETKLLFPNARVYRMDADTVTSRADYEKVYSMMLNNEIDILIGTQMLAKGLDFPNVTLVGVMAADISLNLPDYRAAEKTYQLITQVSGRAGRGEYEGRVIIQTYKPDHYAIKTSSKNEYYNFFKMEIENRKKFSYPPFQNILIINLSSENRKQVISYAGHMIKSILAYTRKISIRLDELTGPTPSIIERINNKYRYNVILKSRNLENLLKIGKFINDKVEKNREIYINYHINPDSVY